MLKRKFSKQTEIKNFFFKALKKLKIEKEIFHNVNKNFKTKIFRKKISNFFNYIFLLILKKPYIKKKFSNKKKLKQNLKNNASILLWIVEQKNSSFQEY